MLMLGSWRVQGFYVPFLRHLWWWLGGRSADKKSMHSILGAGGTVVIIPGGVQECTFMEPGKEVIFLKSRKGFVRVAMQNGMPWIVPLLCRSSCMGCPSYLS